MGVYKFFANYCKIRNSSAIQALVEATEVQSMPRKSILIRSGEKGRDIYFLINGLVRGFFLDSAGKEITDCFCYQYGSVALGTCQLGTEYISPMTIEIVEDSVLYRVPISLILELQEKYLDVTIFYNHVLISVLAEQWQMKPVLYQYSALQRYEWFLETYPNLLGRVSSKNIASFLGMTPETLSRLRKNVGES